VDIVYLLIIAQFFLDTLLQTRFDHSDEKVRCYGS